MPNQSISITQIAHLVIYKLFLRSILHKSTKEFDNVRILRKQLDRRSDAAEGIANDLLIV